MRERGERGRRSSWVRRSEAAGRAEAAGRGQRLSQSDWQLILKESNLLLMVYSIVTKCFYNLIAVVGV